jgi:predicted dehydrogenase
MKFYMMAIRSVFLVFLISLFINPQSFSQANASKGPVRIAVAGLSHGHVAWIVGRKDKTDAVMVGIYEPDTALSSRIAKRYNISRDIIYTDLGKMLDAVKPEALVAFGSIYAHMAAVEAAAPRGIHVMVEKPLASNLQHALKMEELAKKYKILLLTNYETSWYPTTEKTYQLVHDSNFVGNIKKVVIHDGHEGPREIGVSNDFFNWLTDPVLNGGGAIVDFGCYGANLMTYLMKGQEPIAVTAVTRQYKPAIYPKVDDDATIIVDYPDAQCIIQASWNWPFARKDMEVYGQTGYLISANNTDMRMRNKVIKQERSIKLTAEEVGVYTDPFAYLSDVIRGKIQVPKNGLYSLENNLLVVRILEAAKESAKTGKTVKFKK